MSECYSGVAAPEVMQEVHNRNSYVPNMKSTIAVDLDGTLVLTDTLAESALRAFRRRWVTLFKCPFWLWRGKAYFKERLVDIGGIDASSLPYNESLVTYLRTQKQMGRSIVLATASDERIARSVADHLGFFDDIISSNGLLNMKGKTKTRELEKRFGTKNFSYAGNDASDLKVWERAASTLIVNATPSVARRARQLAPVEMEISMPTKRALTLLSAMRVYQWVKNLLVFAAPAAAHTLLQPDTFIPATLTFFAFCFSASGVYLLNDFIDVEADRKHSNKRKRPFASGVLPFSYALWAPVLFVAGILLAFATSGSTALAVLGYVVLTTAYSFALKTRPLADVFCLAVLYSMRLIAGGVATDTPISIWLLGFSSFLFLALALVKRSAELIAMPASEIRRRAYTKQDVIVLQIMGIASSFASSLILMLYMNSEAVKSAYPARPLLYGIVPTILFWQCRLWFSTVRGYMKDDPIVYASKDWVSWATFVVVLALSLAATFVELPLQR